MANTHAVVTVENEQKRTFAGRSKELEEFAASALVFVDWQMERSRMKTLAPTLTTDEHREVLPSATRRI